MGFPDPFVPRARPLRAECPFCAGLAATGGRLCNLCRREGLLAGGR